MISISVRQARSMKLLRAQGELASKQTGLDKMGIDVSKAGKENRTYNGRVYDSRAEMREAFQLDLKKRSGLIRDWEPQARVPLVVNGVKVCAMVVDFKVTLNDGQIEWREIKGFETAVYILKRKLFAACFPDAKYVVLKAWR